MLLLADENFPHSSYSYLKEKGFDIKHVGASNTGISDQEVIKLSISEKRVITTFDSDFGELIFKYSFKPFGVIFFRWREFQPLEPGRLLEELLEDEMVNFAGYLTVIDERQIRQRKI